MAVVAVVMVMTTMTGVMVIGVDKKHRVVFAFLFLISENGFNMSHMSHMSQREVSPTPPRSCWSNIIVVEY